MSSAAAITDLSSPIEILLVDDEPSIRLLLRRWIERSLDAKITEVSDGLQALEEIANGHTELMILDLNMPVLNGIDTLRLLQADSARDRIEVVIASEVAAEERIREVISLGVSDYLLKPLQFDWVTQRLKLASERIHRRRQATGTQIDRSRTRLLIADPDPNYCQFAESTLSASFSVAFAHTVAETLVKTLRFQPDAILLSPTIPGLRMDFLADRLKALPGAGEPPLYEIVAPGVTEPSNAAAKGVIPRSFVPETLRAELLSLLRGGPAPERGVLGWASGLAGELTTALFQALGMMTGAEPLELKTPPPDLKPVVFGRIDIIPEDGSFEMELRLESQGPFAGALLAAMLGEEESADTEEAPPLDAVQEILNVVAGRVKNSCLERKVAVNIGLPEVGMTPLPSAKAHCEIDRYFRWKGSHEFRLMLLASPTNV